MAFKMGPEEKVYLDRLVALSGKDANTVRSILRSLIWLFCVDYYSGETSIIIPYIAKMDFSFATRSNTNKETKTLVKLKAEACQALIDELGRIYEGDKTETLQYLKKNLFSSVEDILEIKEDEVL